MYLKCRIEFSVCFIHSGTFTTIYAAYNSLVMRGEVGDWRGAIDLVPAIATMRRQRHPWDAIQFCREYHDFQSWLKVDA